MGEPLREIFVDFNRRAAERGRYITWANQFPGPIPLGTPLRLTDFEGMEFDGYVAEVSSNGRDVVVAVGAPPATGTREQQVRHLGVREIAFAQLLRHSVKNAAVENSAVLT